MHPSPRLSAGCIIATSSSRGSSRGFRDWAIGYENAEWMKRERMKIRNTREMDNVWRRRMDEFMSSRYESVAICAEGTHLRL